MGWPEAVHNLGAYAAVCYVYTVWFTSTRSMPLETPSAPRALTVWAATGVAVAALVVLMVCGMHC